MIRALRGWRARHQDLERVGALRQLRRALRLTCGGRGFGRAPDPRQRLFALAAVPQRRSRLQSPDDVFSVVRARFGKQGQLERHARLQHLSHSGGEPEVISPNQLAAPMSKCVCAAVLLREHCQAANGFFMRQDIAA